jgi:hypothetical protein
MRKGPASRAAEYVALWLPERCCLGRASLPAGADSRRAR